MSNVDTHTDTQKIEPPPGVPEGKTYGGARYLDRELTWLEFNRRVLHQAVDDRTPLLERVFFLNIFTSNLDEFVMKRVGGIKRQRVAGILKSSADGRTPRQQLRGIRKVILPMLKQQAECFRDEILPALTENRICLVKWEQLSEDEKTRANAHFRRNVFPVLTPLAVDPGHPFPFISNLSTSLGVMLRHPDREETLFARVKVPEVLKQWIRVDDESALDTFRFLSLQDLICQNLDQLFPDMIVTGVMPFRVTRNADVEREEEDAEDLLEMIEEELRARRFAEIVRIEHGPNPNPWILQFLVNELHLDEEDVYEVPDRLEYTSLHEIASLNLPGLKYEPWLSVPPAPQVDSDADLFSIIRAGDLLVHSPYESFQGSVERFITAAADDPKVLAIKMTVYRTGDQSPFIHALIRAAQSGKQVVCLVELKARFDEERNIFWAHEMEKAGIHVVYGVVGLKTHNKCALVVRQDGDGLRCYAHIGTGNYNSQTARLYTDFGLLTCRPEITEELVEVFHFLTGRSLKIDYQKLLVAPVNMKKRLLEMIERETENQKAGRPAAIFAKMNSLEERDIIDALYEASQAGVPIELIVRGFCCLRPGVKGLSENIKVVSVIGRFLEHSRIYYFRNGAENPLDGEFYIGSADWMYRNLLARVEAIAPVEGLPQKEKLWEVLGVMRDDHRQAWDMQSDGSYVLRYPPADGDPKSSRVIGSHQCLMDITKERASR